MSNFPWPGDGQNDVGSQRRDLQEIVPDAGVGNKLGNGTNDGTSVVPEGIIDPAGYAVNASWKDRAIMPNIHPPRERRGTRAARG
jgi:hypothetical protein